jgi:hypothetical protein
MKARPSARIIAALAFCCSVEARADTPSPPRSRLYTGSTFSFSAHSSLTVDGRAQDEEGGAVGLAFSLGYLQRLLPHLGAGLFAGLGSAPSYWSEQRGETRNRAQLALGPVFFGTAVRRRPTIEWRIGLPIGYTRAWLNPGPSRAVEESYSPANGVNFSLIGGLDILGAHHGGYVDLGYTLHLTWLTHTAILKADSSVQSQQSYRYFDRALVLGTGYTYRF